VVEAATTASRVVEAIPAEAVPAAI
jgi:hypothetical protein